MRGRGSIKEDELMLLDRLTAKGEPRSSKERTNELDETIFFPILFEVVSMTTSENATEVGFVIDGILRTACTDWFTNNYFLYSNLEFPNPCIKFIQLV